MCSFIFFISTVVLHPGRFHSHDPSASQQSYLIRNNKSAQFVNIYFNVFVAFTFGHMLEPNHILLLHDAHFCKLVMLLVCQRAYLIRQICTMYILHSKNKTKQKENRKKTRKAHQTSLDPLKPLSC